jgi:hypothetical protein
MLSLYEKFKQISSYLKKNLAVYLLNLLFE